MNYFFLLTDCKWFKNTIDFLKQCASIEEYAFCQSCWVLMAYTISRLIKQSYEILKLLEVNKSISVHSHSCVFFFLSLSVFVYIFRQRAQKVGKNGEASFSR